MSNREICSGKLESLFISEPIYAGWIIEKLMRDLASELETNGIRVSFGKLDEYDGQDVVFHSRYLYSSAVKEAKLNSVFVTHVDDKIKELELTSRFNEFDSFICMAPQDALFLRQLGCDPRKLLGANLPHRGGQIRRPKLAFFSECYNDGRKNEAWILEYLESKSSEERNSLIFCFLGYNWEDYCIKLAKLGVSYELYRYDRSLPGEYNAQKVILERMDYMIYPGFDGGAMCVYDGMVAGTHLLVADNGYHRGLEGNVLLFNSKEDFFIKLDGIVSDVRNREKSFLSRGIGVYAESITSHWNSLLQGQAGFTSDDAKEVTNSAYGSEVKLFRSHYKPVSLARLISSTYRTVRRLF